MQTPVKALTIATTASLAALVAATVAAGSQVTVWVPWACCAALAVTTAAVLVADRRKPT
ncbi:hypothetical protein ACFVDQ_25915 [Streptomyces sp. NPDC057684]|uniref:hypothetical protein n=1 Tax=unclassified Streptomyces TaxID=2593676 RepID=UPI00367CC7E3